MKSNRQAPISVLIPHYLGDVVLRCVESVARESAGVDTEIIVVDDQPQDDGSLKRLRAAFPSVNIVGRGGGRGFGWSANVGIAAASADLVVVLNNDVVVGEGWLPPILDAASLHPEAAAFQAKVRSLYDRERFDYGGAGGGLIDIFGYPYALGRLFDVVDRDFGQHDEEREIFWAVGCALVLRKHVVLEVGGFDEAYHMHMEEIDLCWRLKLRGWTVRSVPASVLYHEGGHSLKTGCFQKTALNHRNSLVLILKCWSIPTLIWLFPTRCALEFLTIVYGLLRHDWRHPLAAIWAMIWVVAHLPSIARRRAGAQAHRSRTDSKIMDGMHRGSIVFERFVLRRHSVPETSSKPKPPIHVGAPAICSRRSMDSTTIDTSLRG